MEIFLIPILAAISVEDFRFRTVHVGWFGLLLAWITLFALGQKNWIFINLSFITVQLTILSLYFSLRTKKLVNLLKTHLGLGDIVLYILLSLSFSPLNFIVFFIGSHILILLIFGVYTVFSANKPPTIPLAGGMTLLWINLIVFQKLGLFEWNLQDDMVWAHYLF